VCDGIGKEGSEGFRGFCMSVAGSLKECSAQGVREPSTGEQHSDVTGDSAGEDGSGSREKMGTTSWAGVQNVRQTGHNGLLESH
jgi:hypothetical protein